MNTLSRRFLWVACVGAGLYGSAAAQTASNGCDQAWASYNEFKQRNVMEPSQYAFTAQGAAVRAACGQDALPAPPGADTPHRPIVRKPVKPSEKPKPP